MTHAMISSGITSSARMIIIICREANGKIRTMPGIQVKLLKEFWDIVWILLACVIAFGVLRNGRRSQVQAPLNIPPIFFPKKSPQNSQNYNCQSHPVVQNLFVSAKKLVFAEIWKIMFYHFRANVMSTQSLTSIPLAPLLMKICVIWEWFGSKNF